MPEHLRALVVILALALPVFWLGRRVLCPALIDTADFVRRRNLWFGITLAAFLSHNFWLFVVIATLMLLWGASARRERNPLAMFFFLLFAVPAISGVLPGLGLFQTLFSLHHVRLLELVVLLPLALRLMRDSDAPRMGHYAADWFVLGYAVLQAFLNLSVLTLTQSMRAIFYVVIDMLLVYYVASRSCKDERALRDVTASFCMALLVIVPIAVFEFGKKWLLYAALSPALGLGWDGGQYLARESLLRATGPAGHSLALGYAFAVALGLWIGLQRLLPAGYWWLGALGLVAGLIAPVSRSPWVGAALIVIVAALLGRHAGPRILKLTLGAIGVVALVLVSPWGEKLIDYLPFVGSVETGSITYRSRLFEVSLYVISLNPFLGSPSFLANPLMEQMRQGQGIIDLVNSYIGVTLSSGLVGLVFFAGIFVAAFWSAVAGLRSALQLSPQIENLGRALAATLVGVAMMISAVSSILAIPTIYWSLAGLAVGYGAMVRAGSTRAGAPEPSSGRGVRPALPQWRGGRHGDVHNG